MSSEKAHHGAHHGGGGGVTAAMRAELTELFSYFDTDHDGVVSTAEFMSVRGRVHTCRAAATAEPVCRL
jgi:hypothetical protein